MPTSKTPVPKTAAEPLASFALNLLRHLQFRSHAQRMGKVLRLQPSGMVCWQRNAARETCVDWS